MKAVAIYLDHK